VVSVTDRLGANTDEYFGGRYFMKEEYELKFDGNRQCFECWMSNECACISYQEVMLSYLWLPLPIGKLKLVPNYLRATI
jgi:hypothetical protein